MKFITYAKKKALRAFLKDLDQKYLGGFIRRRYRQEDRRKESDVPCEDQEQIKQDIIQQIRKPIPDDRNLKRVEIIILKYRDPEVETECAKRLIENTEWPYKLVFWDNRAGVKNMGKIWNKLIRESTCDYVVWMDSDAFVPKLAPCWLTRCMRVFEEHPGCMVVSPKLTRIGMKQQQADIPRNNPPERIVDEFANTCCVFKKEVFDRIGYYDEDFLIYGADSEWAARFVARECEGYLMPDVLADHVHHYSAKKSGEKQEYNRSAEAEYAKDLYLQKIKMYDKKKIND